MKCSSKIKLESLRTILKNMMKNQTDTVKSYSFGSILEYNYFEAPHLSFWLAKRIHVRTRTINLLILFKITVVILMVQAINARNGSSFILNPFHYSPNYCCKKFDILYSRFTIIVTIIKLFN